MSIPWSASMFAPKLNKSVATVPILSSARLRR